jgi:hypothetical protein
MEPKEKIETDPNGYIMNFTLPYEKDCDFGNVDSNHILLYDTSFLYYASFDTSLPLLTDETTILMALHNKSYGNVYKPMDFIFESDTSVKITPNYVDNWMKVDYVVNHETIETVTFDIVPKTYCRSIPMFNANTGEKTDTLLVEWLLKCQIQK